MTPIERNIRRWLGTGLTFHGHGEHGLVREIIGSYQSVRAEEIEQLEALQTMAKVTGFDGDVMRMLGASICESDGSRTLTLTPEKARLAK